MGHHTTSMNRIVCDLLAAVHAGAVEDAGRLSVVPLIGPAGGEARSRPLTRIRPRDDLRLSERDGEARLEELTIFNGTARTIFVLEGELLEGGYQDRMVTSSQIVPERSASLLPTACAEEGRFEGDDLALRTSGLIASPRFRRRLRLGLYGAAPGPLPDARQEAVWQEIESDRVVLGVDGSGISMLSLRSPTRAACTAMTRRLQPAADEIGWLLFVDRRFVGADLLPGPGLASAYRRSLLEAAAYDGLVQAIRSGPAAVPERPGDLDTFDRFWSHMVGEIRSALVLEEQSLRQTHLRFESPALAGSVLLQDGQPLHLSLFPAIYPEDIAGLN